MLFMEKEKLRNVKGGEKNNILSSLLAILTKGPEKVKNSILFSYRSGIDPPTPRVPYS
jgi:hypothetical protein